VRSSVGEQGAARRASPRRLSRDEQDHDEGRWAVNSNDRLRWDDRYSETDVDEVQAELRDFGEWAETFPVRGNAIDVACGRGAGALWLALRGLDVVGIDVSPIAVELARVAAERIGIAHRCRFEVVDLDDGLPGDASLDVILCQRFRDPALDQAMIDRLADRGTLAISALSEVGAEPGRFRAERGALVAAFADLTVVMSEEGEGVARMLATR
jgi:hypothetical protein